MTDYFSYTLDADAIRAISSIGLAHLGDAVYELLVRTYLCAHGKATGKGLHRATVELVRAPKQAELADAIFGELTDEEHDVFRRGRNAVPEGHGARGALRLALFTGPARAHQRTV